MVLGNVTKTYLAAEPVWDMAGSSTATGGTDTVVQLSRHPVGYVGILMAVITGVLHLVLAPNALEMNQTMGVLFILNGLGFLVGVAVYLTRFWRRELYIVAALYALATIVALFVFQGFGVDAFYMRGSLNPMAVITKAVEAVIVVCAVYLYAAED